MLAKLRLTSERPEAAEPQVPAVALPWKKADVAGNPDARFTCKPRMEKVASVPRRALNDRNHSVPQLLFARSPVTPSPLRINVTAAARQPGSQGARGFAAATRV